MFASPKNLAIRSDGLAPFSNQYLIRSTSKFNLSFLSFGNKGLKKPTFSINLPSLGFLESAMTILYTGLFFAPPLDILIFNIVFLSLILSYLIALVEYHQNLVKLLARP